MGNMFDKNYFNRSIKNQRGFFWVPNPFPPHQRFFINQHTKPRKLHRMEDFCSTSTNNFKMHIYLLISRCHQFSVICWSIWREICVILNCNCTREIQNTVPLARTGCFVETISVFFDLQSFGIKLLFHFK